MRFKLSISDNFLAGVLSVLGSPSFLCVLGSRMLFNLKEAVERGQNERMNYWMTSSPVSGGGFAEPRAINLEGEISSCLNPT